MTIILRTVCGCERMVNVFGYNYPARYQVPYIRRNNYCLTAEQFNSRAVPDHSIRIFERTGQSGLYGYPVYLEL